MFAVVVIMGGTADPIIAVLAMVTGGLGNVVVKSGNNDAAVGTVALPDLYCGCTTPASDGGTDAGATVSGGVIFADPTGGGGNGGVIASACCGTSFISTALT